MTRYPVFLIDKNTYHAKHAGNLSSCFPPEIHINGKNRGGRSLTSHW